MTWRLCFGLCWFRVHFRTTDRRCSHAVSQNQFRKIKKAKIKSKPAKKINFCETIYLLYPDVFVYTGNSTRQSAHIRQWAWKCLFAILNRRPTMCRKKRFCKPFHLSWVSGELIVSHALASSLFTPIFPLITEKRQQCVKSRKLENNGITSTCCHRFISIFCSSCEAPRFVDFFFSPRVLAFIFIKLLRLQIDVITNWTIRWTIERFMMQLAFICLTLFRCIKPIE